LKFFAGWRARAAELHAGSATPSEYWAFLSYSHEDDLSRWLSRAIERYRIPKRLPSVEREGKPFPRRLYPVFRDRDELPASTNLGSALRRVIARSRNFIVICSPAAAGSHWVNEEIREFRATHEAGRIFGIITSGTPETAYPSALLEDEHGQRIPPGSEPLAADVRPGRDSRDDAKLRLIAGILGVGFDELKRRDRSIRRINVVIRTAVAAMVVVALAVGAVGFAGRQRAQLVASVHAAADDASKLVNSQPALAAALAAASNATVDDATTRGTLLDVLQRQNSHVSAAVSFRGAGKAALADVGRIAVAALTDQPSVLRFDTTRPLDEPSVLAPFDPQRSHQFAICGASTAPIAAALRDPRTSSRGSSSARPKQSCRPNFKTSSDGSMMAPCVERCPKTGRSPETSRVLPTARKSQSRFRVIRFSSLTSRIGRYEHDCDIRNRSRPAPRQTVWTASMRHASRSAPTADISLGREKMTSSNSSTFTLAARVF
jgi:hypothetical protein